MTADADWKTVPAPPGLIFHVGRRPDPFYWYTPPKLDLDQPAGSRFDDPHGEYATLYCASTPYGALLEKLCPLRPIPEIAAQYASALDDDVDPDFDLSPTGRRFPVSFVDDNVLGTAALDHELQFVDVEEPRNHRILETLGGAALLRHLEVDRIDRGTFDERTRAIALFVETIRRPHAFSSALERCCASGKPVVCLKVGRSEAAARSALAHTGAIVGSQRAFSALLRRHAAIEVDDIPELVEVLEVLNRRRRPRGTRAASVSESGGEAALLADHATANGVQMEPFPVAVADALKREFPLLQHANNPLDAWALDAPERIYPRALSLIAASDAYDMLLAQVDLSRFRSAENQAWSRVVLQALGETVAAREDLVGAVVTVHTSDPPDWACELARKSDIALLRGSHNAMLALGRVARYVPRTRRTVGWGPPIVIDDLLVGHGVQPEFESSAVLERYGLTFAARRRANTPEEAAAAVRELGSPVVVKRDGTAHKAASGGVRLGISTPEEARQATLELGTPVLVASQMSEGRELICGMLRDPQVGPVIVFGQGGVGVERIDSLSALVGPLDDIDIATLIADVGISDRDGSLARAIRAVDRLAAEHPEVLEIDVNPLIVTADRVVAVDALIVVDRQSDASLDG
jgi:hypothetical protein